MPGCSGCHVFRQNGTRAFAIFFAMVKRHRNPTQKKNVNPSSPVTPFKPRLGSWRPAHDQWTYRASTVSATLSFRNKWDPTRARGKVVPQLWSQAHEPLTVGRELRSCEQFQSKFEIAPIPMPLA